LPARNGRRNRSRRHRFSATESAYAWISVTLRASFGNSNIRTGTGHFAEKSGIPHIVAGTLRVPFRASMRDLYCTRPLPILTRRASFDVARSGFCPERGRTNPPRATPWGHADSQRQFSPERALQALCSWDAVIRAADCHALAGLPRRIPTGLRSPVPGRCPGLTCGAPVGREECNSATSKRASERPKPFPRLRFGLVLNVSFVAAGSIYAQRAPDETFAPQRWARVSDPALSATDGLQHARTAQKSCGGRLEYLARGASRAEPP